MRKARRMQILKINTAIAHFWRCPVQIFMPAALVKGPMIPAASFSKKLEKLKIKSMGAISPSPINIS